MSERQKDQNWDRKSGWKTTTPPTKRTDFSTKRPWKLGTNKSKHTDKLPDAFDKVPREKRDNSEKNLIEFMLVPLLLAFLVATMLCALLYKLCIACNGTPSYFEDEEDGEVEIGGPPLSPPPASGGTRPRSRPRRSYDSPGVMIGMIGHYSRSNAAAPKHYRHVRTRADRIESRRSRGQAPGVTPGSTSDSMTLPSIHQPSGRVPVPPPYEEIAGPARGVFAPPRSGSPPPTYDEAVEQG